MITNPRARGPVWWLALAVGTDMFLTTIMFIVVNTNTSQLRRTQESLRSTQIDRQTSQRTACEETARQSNAIRVKDKAILLQQQKALAALTFTLSGVPTLNTKSILDFSRKNLQQTIDIYTAEIAAFAIPDCKKAFPIDSDTRSTVLTK